MFYLVYISACGPRSEGMFMLMLDTGDTVVFRPVWA